MRLSGLITALVTPFRDGKLDEKGFRENLDFQIASGVDGVLVLGATGESSTLTDEEKQRLIALAVEKGSRKLHVMVGTGGNSTAATIAATERAKKMGADSALVVAPYYNRPTQKGLYEHFSAIAKAVDLPLLVYNVPGRTGVNIETMTLREIAQLPNVIGVKDASGSIDQMGDVLQHIASEHPDFAVFSGDDHHTFPLLALGGHGVISMLGNLAPTPILALLKAMERGELALARQLHFRFLPLFKAMFFETNPIPIKEAMNLCGRAAGPCRLPLTPLSEPHRSSLLHLLAEAELLPAGVSL